MPVLLGNECCILAGRPFENSSGAAAMGQVDLQLLQSCMHKANLLKYNTDSPNAQA